jgi:hypothetical protein
MFFALASKYSFSRPLIVLEPTQNQQQIEQTVVIVPIIFDGIMIPVFAGTGLPPDPGSEGDLTIAGVDSDGDGIRDDVERKISLMYPNHSSVRNYSYQIAISLQDAIDNPTSVSQQNKSLSEVLSANDCLKRMSIDNLHVGTREILPMVLNTFQRSYSYLNAMKKFQGKEIIDGSKCEDL